MKTPGVPPSAYGERSPHEARVQRIAQSAAPSLGTGSSRTPLESLEGVITPSSLHFERHHNGVPDLDPDTHQVLIHGLVERPLLFSIEALSRYPLVSRIQFLECARQQRGNNAPEPPQQSAGGIHGLLSCSDWTGVPLAVLLEEAGLKPEGAVDTRRRRRCGGHEPQRADREGARRRDPRALSERRAAAAVERLSGAPVPAGLRRQHEREVAAADQGHGRADDDEGRDLEILGPRPGRAREAVHVPDGREVRDHVAVGRADDAAARASTRSPASRGRGSARSGASTCRPTAARRGRKRRSPSPCCRSRSYAFRSPWRWSGSPSVLMSRAVDETGAVQPTRAASDRRARHELSLSLQRDPELESRAKRERSAMCTSERAAARALLVELRRARLGLRARRRSRRACPKDRSWVCP